MTDKILCIGDIHEPWGHPDALPFVEKIMVDYGINPRKDEIVFMGDEIDHHAISFHTSDPDMPSAGDELEQAIDSMQKWYDMFPSAKICVSNHTSRPYRKAYADGLPRRLMKDYGDWLEAPDGWEWKDRWVLPSKRWGNIQFIHGDGFTGEYAHHRAAQTHRISTVIGHVHRGGGVHHFSGHGGPIFGMNAGCLVDNDAAVFAYAKYMARKPTLGVGVIVEDTPIFEPMILDAKGRWVND